LVKYAARKTGSLNPWKYVRQKKRGGWG